LGDFFQILVRVPIGFLLDRFETLNKSVSGLVPQGFAKTFAILQKAFRKPLPTDFERIFGMSCRAFESRYVYAIYTWSSVTAGLTFK